MRWWTFGLITYYKAFRFLSSFLTRRQNPAKAATTFYSFTINKPEYAYVWINVLACIQRIPRAQPKSRIRTQKFHWNIHFERAPISKTCRWKVATQAVAQVPSTACTCLIRAPDPTYRHSLFSGFAERQHFFFLPSQDALHLPASGRIRNAGRFRAGVCILFNSLKRELIHKCLK